VCGPTAGSEDFSKNQLVKRCSKESA